jgi:hypothetical protein
MSLCRRWGYSPSVIECHPFDFPVRHERVQWNFTVGKTGQANKTGHPKKDDR